MYILDSSVIKQQVNNCEVEVKSYMVSNNF